MDDDNPDGDEKTGRRVELNAMTSAHFIDLIERKLTEHGVRKVIPDKARLEDAYRLFVRSDRTKTIVEEAIAGMADELIAVPRDLDQQVRAVLRKEPALSWDKAVRKVLAKRRERQRQRERAAENQNRRGRGKLVRSHPHSPSNPSITPRSTGSSPRTV